MSNQREKSLEERVTEFVTCAQQLNRKAAKQIERDRDAWFGNSRVGSHKPRGIKRGYIGLRSQPVNEKQLIGYLSKIFSQNFL